MSLRLRLLALAFFACVVASCDDDVDFTFRATGLAAAEATVPRNEAIEILFSRRLDEFDVPSDAVRVIDGAGRVVPVRLVAGQRSLRLEPTAPEGWPAGGELSIEMPYPPLGRPLRSREGTALASSFTARARIGTTYQSRSGDLRITPRGFQPGMGEVTADTVFQFECEAPLDPSGLAEAARLVELATGAARLLPVRSENPGRLYVAPFASGGFQGGAAYRIEFTRRLAALDGRRAPPGVGWPFMTAKGITGEHVTLFAPEDLEDPSLKPGRGPLRPVARTTIASSALEAREATSFVLGSGGFRVQAVVPAAAFGGDDALIERLLLPVAAPAGLSTLVAGFELRLGPWPATEEPAASFENNCRGSAPPVALADETSGVVALRVEGDGRIVVRFAAPYLHKAADAAGLPQDLLIDLAVGPGASPDAPFLVLRGERAAPGRRRAIGADQPAAAFGVEAAVVPALEVVALQFTPIALKPWTSDVPSPRYFERADAVVGRGRPFEDFTVEYRALTPSALGGIPVDATPWSPRLSALQGAPVVQARIVFHPRPERPGRVPPEIERLSLPFKSDG
jgi:hypothetical protein